MTITLDGVSFWYPLAQKNLATQQLSPVLDNISLTIQKGEFVLVIGPSGSGKSTLLEVMTGIIPHSTGGRFRGKVHVDTIDIVTDLKEIRKIRGNVVLVLQDPEAQLITPYVIDEVIFGLENMRRTRPEIQELLDWGLDKARLSDKVNAFTYALSGGQKQRLALASCLVMHPKVILMDAPITNLDPIGAQEVLTFIEDVVSKGLTETVIVAANKIDELVAMATRIIVMDQGKIVLDGSPEYVLLQHMDVLERLGLFIPEIPKIFSKLSQFREINMAGMPRSVSEAVTALQPLHLSPPTIIIKESRLSTETVAQINNLSLRYGEGIFVLQGLSLTIRKGESVAILGQNGSGKTTLMKALTGLLTPTSGSVLIEGRDTRTDPPLGRVGYVFQRPSHQLVTTIVEDELRKSLERMPLSSQDVEKRVSYTLKQFGLLDKRFASPFDLSMGEKRRLSVATMAIMQPGIMILDEPTTGLDRANTVKLMEIVHQLVNEQEMTLIQVTHDMEQVAWFTDRAIVIHEGGIIFDGAPHQLFASRDILQKARLQAPHVVQLSQRLWPNSLSPVTVDDFLEACNVTGISGV